MLYLKGLLFFMLLCASSTLACAQSVRTIHGQVSGRKTGTVYLYAASTLGQPAQLIDSVKPTSEFFTVKKVVKEPTTCFLSLNELPGQLYFIWDKDVVVLLNSNNLTESIIEGSTATDAWKAFETNVQASHYQCFKENRQAFLQAYEREDSLQLYQLHLEALTILEKQHAETVTYIQTHKDAWISLFVLAAHYKDLGRKSTHQLLTTLPPFLQQSELGRQINTALNDPDSLLRP